MKRKVLINISFGIVTLVLVIAIALPALVEHWIGKRIETVLNKTNKDYTIKIGEVNVSIFRSSIGLENIKIYSKEQSNLAPFSLKEDITFVRFKGISFMKALFKNEIDIGEVSISNCNLKVKIPFLKRTLPPLVSPYTIRIGSISFGKIDFELGNTLNPQSYSLREGVLKLSDFHINKHDTLSSNIVKQFDFESKECILISADSMYTYKIDDIKYSTSSKILGISKFSIQPNYKDYEFTSRFKYQTNRFEVELFNIYAHDFNAVDYLTSRSMVSSFIEIGNLDMKVFRDKRKEFNHVKKLAFQDMIYSYRGNINIDSISLLNGSLLYRVHAAKANQPGVIDFNNIHAKIFKISNDNIYKTKDAYLVFNADAMLMGKSKMIVSLKSKLFDNSNTFTVNGTLAGLEVKELNPILEKTVFVYAKTGKVDALNYSFKANNTKATGKLTILYNGLNIIVKNKHTDATTAFAEKFMSVVVNSLIVDSNPISGERVRVGIIDYKRDPERFLFNYCFKSILSGIEFSLVKRPKKTKN